MNDTTTGVWTLTKMTIPGGRIILRAVKRPAHRAARGIVAGVVGGAVLWAVLLGVAWLFWRWVVR